MATTNWIKVRNNLATHPKVVRISSALSLQPLHILGALVHLWSVADAHADGEMLPGMDEKALDMLVQIPGFSSELIKVGWLANSGDSLQLVNYQTHNGTSAKRRAEDADRKRTQRGQDADEMRPKNKNKNKKKNIEETPPLPPSRGEPSVESADYDPSTSPIPGALDTPAFRSAWIDWFEYRKERKLPKPKPKTIEAKLNEMIGWGADASVEQIRMSIANGWQGIFEPKKKPNAPTRKGFASDTLTDILGPPSPDGQLPTLGIFDRITAERKAENQQRLLEIKRMRGEANGR